MNVLIAVASRHGSTEGIAGVIAETLSERGLHTSVGAIDLLDDIDEFDAVVVGSAIYMGRWLPRARELVEAHADDLRELPVWFFSSGPVGDPPKPVESPAEVDALAERIGAVEHKVLAGRLDKHGLRLGERAIVRALHVQEGDYRDWDDVRRWASGIADALVVASEA